MFFYYLSKRFIRLSVCNLTLLLLILTVSCSQLDNKAIRDRKTMVMALDKADRVIIDNPQLSYHLLDNLDYNSIKKNKDKARYALLYTEARYKNNLPIENDSLIKVAVLYYSKHKKWDSLFRSYYLLGCVYSLSELYSDAAVAFAQASELIDYIDNDFQIGLLYSRMADIFYDNYDYTRAEYYYKNAASYFNKAGKEYYMTCAKGYVANCKVQKGDYQNSIDVYNELIEWTEKVDCLDLKSQYLTNKLICLVLCGEIESVKLSLDSIITENDLFDNNSILLNIMARYYISEHNDYAREIIDKAWVTEPIDSVNLFYTESLYYEQMGDLSNALYFYRKSMSLNKQIALKALDQSLIGAQSDYYRTMSELETLKAHNRLVLFFSTFILLLLIILVTILFIMNHKRKTDEQIRQNLFAIDELTARDSISQKSIQNLNVLLKEKNESIESLKERIIDLSSQETINKTRIQQLNTKVREMLRQQYVLPDYLYTRYYEQIDDTKKADRLYKIVKNQITEFTSPKNLERLDKMLNDTFGDLMDKLSSPILNLQQKEKLLLRLVLTDISAKSMAAILNDTNQNINQRKKRLLEKIGRKDPGLLLELNNALNS